MPIHTPWKKSRKYGDVYGGRKWPKIADRVFNRAHSIEKPSPTDVLPIVMQDNPSRDFFFPLSAEEILEALRSLPEHDYEDITHVWLRRPNKQDYIDGKLPYAWFTCGSGVHLIVMFAWPKDLRISYGKKRPPNSTINDAARFGAKLECKGTEWVSQWTLEAARKFCLHILYHEVGHHIDWYYRHWSKANKKATEESAEQYAFAKTATASHVFNNLEKAAGASQSQG